MPYSWIIDGDATADQPYVRMHDTDFSGSQYYNLDLFNIHQDGSALRFQRTDYPGVHQSGSAVQNSGTTVTALWDEFATATADNLIVCGVLVDETPGTRTITTPTGFTSMGGNTLHGSMRLNTYVKKADGTETGVAVTVSGSTEFGVVIAELSGFINDGVFLKDIGSTDTGNSTTLAQSTTQEPVEAVEVLLGFMAHRGTNPSTASTGIMDENNGALKYAQAATTTMILELHMNVQFDFGGSLDFGATLNPSQNWIARLLTISPTIRYIEAGEQGGVITNDLFLRNMLTMQIDEVPSTPPSNHARVYVRENPGASGKEQLVVMFDTGEIIVLASKT